MQSRLHSLIESCANVLIGYLVALGGQMIVFPLVDLDVSLSQNLTIGVAFTAISLARSYCVRRLFNRWHRG
jgi:hypothetical protein